MLIPGGNLLQMCPCSLETDSLSRCTSRSPFRALINQPLEADVT